MELHIIYLEESMLLSKKEYSGGWREIQDTYETYKSSLGPWGTEDVLEYIKHEYPKDWKKSKGKIIEFLSGSEIEFIL